MFRRCYFLDNLPAFNYNEGAAVADGKLGTSTMELGTTLMKAMLTEVNEFCNLYARQNWTLKPHDQVR